MNKYANILCVQSNEFLTPDVATESVTNERLTNVCFRASHCTKSYVVPTDLSCIHLFTLWHNVFDVL